MARAVTNQDHSFEAGSLTDTGHLLDELELHYFLFWLVLEEIIDDLSLLDGEENLKIFSRDWTFPYFTKRPSLVTGCH